MVETSHKMNSHVLVVTTAQINAYLENDRLVSSGKIGIFAPVPHETPP